MSETRLLLLRHAETSAPDRFHGAESDIDLGERGLRQATAIAEILAAERAAAVYSSGMKRAVATAEPIAARCGRQLVIEPELHERRMGPLSGTSREQGLAAYTEAKRRWMAGDVDYSHPGGESYAQIERRVMPILTRVARAHAGQTVIVVAHGVVIRVALATLLDDHGPAAFERFAIDNVAINDLRFDGTRWRAEALNRKVVDGLESFAW